MGKANFFQPNSHNAICDICGHKMKKSMLRPTWDGFLACLPNDCWYPKHPFDSPLPVVLDNLTVKDARPELPDVFVEEGSLSRWGQSWFTYNMEPIVNPIWGQMSDLKWGKMG